MSKTIEVTLKLPVDLTAGEKNERADEMAKAIEDSEKLKEEKKNLTSEINEDIKEKAGIIRNLARIIASGKEERNVKCEERWNYATRKVTIARLDTGEVLDDRTRTMADEERQESLIKDSPKASTKGEATKSRRRPKGGDPLADMERASPKKEAEKGDPLAGMEDASPKKEVKKAHKKGDPLAGMETNDQASAG